MRDLTDYSLKGHNTFGIDVKCRRFVEFANVRELDTVLCSLSDADMPLLVIGMGSNILFTSDFNGTILHSDIKGIEPTIEGDDVFVRCGSGERMDDIVNCCVNNNWYGLENLSLIPGDVGASAVQNIGAYGAEIKDCIFNIEAVELKTGRRVELSNEDCGYDYRWSNFKGDWKNRFVITFVTYRLSKSFSPNLEYGNIREELDKRGISEPDAKQLRNVIIDIRKAKLPDPDIEGNAGSFFMNPIVPMEKFLELRDKYNDVPHYTVNAEFTKIPAGWLIDQCGWKGKSLGRAGVHSQQALVLVNRGEATGKDILKLCERIRSDVKKKFGIEISPEVNIF
ncbi:MAG: UDP-N-acetylmuramate dehydrogenase [Prevotella sp.]|nr:UDP-N-acetylmuramate dehydrogenase [Prevotella sp.]